MDTTIQISKELLESYENIIWDLIEDRMEFSDETKRNIEKAEKEIKTGKTIPLERIKIRPYHFVKRKEGTPYFIARIGEYRAILDINNQQQKIFAMEVGHRKNIYKD